MSPQKEKPKWVLKITEAEANAAGVRPCGEHLALCPGTAYGNEYNVLWNTINAQLTANDYVRETTKREMNSGGQGRTNK